MIFNTILKNGETIALYDARTSAQKKAQLQKVQQAYDGISELLTRAELPTTEAWLRAIAQDGEQGLRQTLAEDMRRSARAAGMNARAERIFLRLADDDLDDAIAQRAEELRRAVSNATDGLPVTRADLAFQDGRFILDTDALTEKIETACTLPVTKRQLSDVEDAKKFILHARALEEKGIDTALLLTNFLGDTIERKYPDIDLLKLLEIVVVMRRPDRKESLAQRNAARDLQAKAELMNDGRTIGGLAVTELPETETEKKPKEEV